MTTANTRLITVTDDGGKFVIPESDRFEPHPGSVVLTKGKFGTAWQRHFADGLWWPAIRGGTSRTWEQLSTDRGVIIIYDAEVRP